MSATWKKRMPAKQFGKKWSDHGRRRSGALLQVQRAHASGPCRGMIWSACVSPEWEGEHFRPPKRLTRILRCRKIAKKETRVEINCVCAADVFSINFGFCMRPPKAAFEGSRRLTLWHLLVRVAPLALLGSIKNRIMRMLANSSLCTRLLSP